MHKSIKLNTPVEFINITPLNPLISQCQIKVCYVDDNPNRNGSIITKEVAKQMANSLPGCPIVGFYGEEEQDYEEHNRMIDISNGKFEIKDTTKPYGFVDLNAKVWFQKFIDDDSVEREYMMTEGWLWTGQYPECTRIIEKGNNQSMELDPDSLNAEWTKDENGNLEFFIINEAIISKLCILGVNNEPCFEGAQITAPIIQFAFEDGFKEQLFSMMNELKEYLNKGGKEVFTRYPVEIGDALWTALYSHIKGDYSIEGVYEDGEQKFAVLVADENYYRLDFSLLESNEVEFAAEAIALEGYEASEEPQFDPVKVAEYAAASEKEDEDEEEKCPECGKPLSECECEDKEKEEDKKDKYVLDEIQEYVELSAQYSVLEGELNEARQTIESLNAQIDELTNFKLGVEKVEKQKMIDSFYMLSDEDKKDIITNIDNYSLEDIEAKLSVICVRNKVSFSLEDDNKDVGPTSFSLNADTLNEDTGVPAWILALRSVAKDM